MRYRRTAPMTTWRLEKEKGPAVERARADSVAGAWVGKYGMSDAACSISAAAARRARGLLVRFGGQHREIRA